MKRISSILGAAALCAGCALSEGTAPISSGGGSGSLKLEHAKEMQLGGGVFSPSVQSIPAGDSIYYSFVGGTHNVMFTPQETAPENVPNTSSPNTVKRVFEHPGTYDFACTRHAGMTGRVFVQ
jgi:plastocyanin